MEVQLSPEQQRAIEGLAAENGTTPGEEVRRIVEESLQRGADYDRWFREKVREGRDAAERGEFVEHEEVGKILEKRFAD